MTSIPSLHVLRHDMSYESIRNYTFDEFIAIFGTTKLDISAFWLINSGYDKEGNKKYVHVVLRGCQVRPFFGPHYVSVIQEDNKMHDFWINSLTALRRQVFQFTDRLSFERSTYLLPFHDGETMIRLKSVRTFLQIPVLRRGEKIPRSPRKNNQIREHLLETCMQTMISYIDREKEQDMEDTIIEIKEFVDRYCNKLVNKT